MYLTQAFYFYIKMRTDARWSLLHICSWMFMHLLWINDSLHVITKTDFCLTKQKCYLNFFQIWVGQKKNEVDEQTRICLIRDRCLDGRTSTIDTFSRSSLWIWFKIDHSFCSWTTTITSHELFLFTSAHIRFTYRVTQIKTYSWDNAQVVLVGNKCDLANDRAVSVDWGRRLAQQLGEYGCFPPLAFNNL